MHLTLCSGHVTHVFRSECTTCRCLNVKEILAWCRCKIWTLNHLIRKRTKWPNWSNDWAVFLVPICTVHFTVCSGHVKYAFQGESTLYSCLNVKELLIQRRREMWSLSDCNWTRNKNHLVWKQTLNTHSKYLSVGYIWLYVLVMARTRFRVNPHSIVAWMSRNCLP